MKKLGAFVFGTVVGAAAGLAAAAYLLPDETLEDLKQKINDNDTLNDLKKKYDNSTEIVKNQLAAFPKNVEDDSELKDFDDIVIDSTKHNLGSDENDDNETLSDLENAEK
ncbi:DUF1269 domain-containing family protein [Lactobacillus mulieris]|uniref:DUF1269 domain-containing family protein n=1 Tax=Lactobacillus mulieris TaxID=2508708 RepID=UPI00143281BD|nr:DUF1269 domain-containing family protein [Lactobacillus mulieris]MCF1783750.1 DUF1269 domain-containing family protein [Lactobacillus mulieris]MCW8104348.1 DUF1269 domain-containing family protein [Lactobacillus mulieris]MDK6803242.1 DUF1269 domain-containing family protein [Lactobacillus mulieris]MDK8382358.1 DUF1269 domain-containing family protein [Lactobacillus mulieris]MDT9620587.1 DUF1269 domain-containing family protein [Lactobacillus mulieris]